MATADARPLITPPPSTEPSSLRVGLGIVIVAIALLTFWPTLDNGFLPLGFDDAIIADTPEIHGLSWENSWRLATRFNHAHYIPLTLQMLAVDHALWGLAPRGYHLTNIVLHALAALLLYVFLLALLPSWAAAVAAGIFAVHPVQMEAVSVAMQRKTVLAGALFFATLIWYQQWRRRGHAWLYAAALLTYALAALAKPIVVALPPLLLLYDYVFSDRRGRFAHTIPFFIIAVAVCVAAAAAHATLGATRGPHGGSLIVHVLMVSRATLESVTALVLPINLSPIYYYQKDMGYAPLNIVALLCIPVVVVCATMRRRRHPWAFFCVWWIVLVCAPEANVFPLAQLRADRFLYLAVPGAGMGFAVATATLSAHATRPAWRYAVALVPGVVALALLATVSYRSAAVWRSNITAWTRVVDRHPWSVTARTMLGRAYLAQGSAREAERAFVESTRINAQIPEPYLYLAQLYLDHGERAHADAVLQRVLELAPDHPEAQRLLAVMRGADRRS
jgi:tetratricopeptide (TPR) repeat protein